MRIGPIEFTRRRDPPLPNTATWDTRDYLRYLTLAGVAEDAMPDAAIALKEGNRRQFREYIGQAPTEEQRLASFVPSQYATLPMVQGRNGSTGATPGRFEEVGASGTIILHGIITDEEYLSDLQFDKAVKVYDQMRRSDGQVKAILQVCMLPLMQAKWTVKAVDDGTGDSESNRLHQEIAQFVQDNLMNGLTLTWPQLLYQVLSFYTFGFSVFEKVWTSSPDGKIRLKKLAFRLPKTIYRWYPNPADGGLNAIQQRVWIIDKDGRGGRYDYPEIPGDRVVVFTREKEGDNFTGVSLLRPCYKHYMYKNGLYKFDAIGAERNSVAVPVMREPQGAEKAQRDFASRILQSFHAHEKAYIQEPFGWEFRLEGMTGRVKDIMASIEHHDMMMARSVLASFLNLDKGGSYALSKDVSSFFLQALHADAETVTSAINKDVIRPLVDANYTVDRYPTLVVEDLDKRDIDTWLRGLSMLYTAGAITQNAETENALRSILGYPDLPAAGTVAGGGTPTVDADTQGSAADEAQGQDRPATEGTKPGAESDGAKAADASLAAQQPSTQSGYWRELLPHEHAQDLAQLDQHFDQAKRDCVAAIAPIQMQQRTAMLAVAQRHLERGQPVDPDRIDVPQKTEMTAALTAAQLAIYEAARRQMRAELHRKWDQRPLDATNREAPDWTAEDYDPDAQTLRDIKGRSVSLAGMLALAARADFSRLLSRQIAAQPVGGAVGAAGSTLDVQALGGQLTEAMSRAATRMVAGVAHPAIGDGRDDEMKALGVETSIFSSVLDNHTCLNCREADGTECVVGSAQYEELDPPYSQCDGADLCRCAWIASWDDRGTSGHGA